MIPASKSRLVLLVALLATAAAGVAFLPVKDWLGQFLDWLQTIGPWGPLLLAFMLGCRWGCKRQARLTARRSPMV